MLIAFGVRCGVTRCSSSQSLRFVESTWLFSIIQYTLAIAYFVRCLYVINSFSSTIVGFGISHSHISTFILLWYNVRKIHLPFLFYNDFYFISNILGLTLWISVIFKLEQNKNSNSFIEPNGIVTVTFLIIYKNIVTANMMRNTKYVP